MHSQVCHLSVFLRNMILNVKEWKWHGDSAAGISLTLIPFGELSCCLSWQMSHHQTARPLRCLSSHCGNEKLNLDRDFEELKVFHP